jgi:hypothetical protein
MPFVNELIPEHEFAAHRFEELDESYIVGAIHSSQWVIDRQTGTYLRPLTRGREDRAAFADWVLGVAGQRHIVQLELLEFKGGRGEPCAARYALRRVNGQQPSEIASVDMDAIRATLKQALDVFGDGGIYASCTSFEAEIVTAQEQQA